MNDSLSNDYKINNNSISYKKKIFMKKIFQKIKENFANDEIKNEIKNEIINPLYNEIKKFILPLYHFYYIYIYYNNIINYTIICCYKFKL